MYLSDNHNSIEKNLVIILLLNLKVSFHHKYVDQLYCRTWNEISTSQNKQKKRKFFFYNFVSGILQEVRKNFVPCPQLPIIRPYVCVCV
jgi:hypothetical protein